MKIKGIQKTTLLDYPDKVSCILFLHGCNFRCGFCHNPELVFLNKNEDFSEGKVLNFLEKRANILEGVCITGGEPLISLDIEFLRKIKDLGYLIKLDTNGSFPNRLLEILKTRLIDYVAMDIKSSPEKYSGVVGTKVDTSKIEESIRIIHDSGIDYEFRTTIVPGIHDVEEVKSIGVWVNLVVGEKPKILYLQGFKNSGKFVDSKYSSIRDVGYNFLEELKSAVGDFFKRVEIRV